MFSILDDRWNIPEILSKNNLVILQFGTWSCAPCHAISKKLEMWSKEHPDTTVVYVPTEKYLEESVQMGVLSSPTIMTYIEGQLYLKESGYFSLEQLLNRMEALEREYKETVGDQRVF